MEDSWSLDDLFSLMRANEEAFEAANCFTRRPPFHTDCWYATGDRKPKTRSRRHTDPEVGLNWSPARTTCNTFFFQAFTQRMPLRLMRIDLFSAFDDFDEFMATNSFTRPRFCDELHETLYAFHDHRVGK